MRHAIRGGLGVVAAMISLALPACQSGLTDDAPLPKELDEAYFRCNVQPVLTKSCSMFACHGTPDRYFRLYGRNRLRYGIADESKRNSFLNAAERKLNYDAARAYIDLNVVDNSLLLKKPLEQDAGGYYHGATKLGTSNVFAHIDDTEYKILVKWASGEKAKDPQCIEPGSGEQPPDAGADAATP
jgi:hypothetical protein